MCWWVHHSNDYIGSKQLSIESQYIRARGQTAPLIHRNAKPTLANGVYCGVWATPCTYDVLNLGHLMYDMYVYSMMGKRGGTPPPPPLVTQTLFFILNNARPSSFTTVHTYRAGLGAARTTADTLGLTFSLSSPPASAASAFFLFLSSFASAFAAAATTLSAAFTTRTAFFSTATLSFSTLFACLSSIFCFFTLTSSSAASFALRNNAIVSSPVSNTPADVSNVLRTRFLVGSRGVVGAEGGSASDGLRANSVSIGACESETASDDGSSGGSSVSDVNLLCLDVDFRYASGWNG